MLLLATICLKNDIGNSKSFMQGLTQANEKYKGDTLLQKSYTMDFLTRKHVQNEGEIQQYYIEDDHDAIIEPWIWECVQLEMKRREVSGGE